MQKSNPELIQKVKTAMLCIQRFQWEQGCAAQAILEYEGLTDEVIMLCEATVLRSAKDGRVGVMDKNESVDDPAAIGEALIVAVEKTKSPNFTEAVESLYQYLKCKAPRTKDGVLYHFDGDWAKEQIWVDAYYMAPPFLCKYGDADEAMKQIKGYRKYLYHEDKRLLSHIWDDHNNKFGRVDFWGVGNGWTVAGLHRVIAMLGDDRKEDKQYLIDYVKALLDGCVIYQREDGLFHNVLDNPDSFIETNVGQMIAYTIYRGVKFGYLDRSYLTYADKARAAAYSKVDEYGFVRGVCGMPMFDAPGVATEGQAFFILMEAAARDLYEK
ncbi:MAG: glycoside hydrolase family 88 protein [Mobilitalea sp.]